MAKTRLRAICAQTRESFSGKMGEAAVRWVKRSDTHQLQLPKMMGFAKSSTHPARSMRTATPARSARPRPIWTTPASARRGRALASVNLSADQRDGALIDLSRVPGLDGREISLAGLVSRAGLPAVGFQEIRR